MKTGTLVLIGAAALFAYHIIGLGAAGENVQILFEGIQVQSVTDYILNFTVQNVSSTAVTVKALTGAVTLDGNSVGNISAFPSPPLVIPAAGQAQLNVTLDLSLLGVAGSVANIINNPGSTLNFEVKGAINVDGIFIPVPFDVTQNVDI